MMSGYTLYRWFKGEADNPFEIGGAPPFAYHFWNYEKAFHDSYWEHSSNDEPIEKAYQRFKENLLLEHLNFISPEGNYYPQNKEYMYRVFDTGYK